MNNGKRIQRYSLNTDEKRIIIKTSDKLGIDIIKKDIRK